MPWPADDFLLSYEGTVFSLESSYQKTAAEHWGSPEVGKVEISTFCVSLGLVCSLFGMPFPAV